MKDKLRELADEMEACWICASNGDGEITLETIDNWSGRLSSIINAEGDGGAVSKLVSTAPKVIYLQIADEDLQRRDFP